MQSPSFLRLSCVEDETYLIYSQNLDDERKPYNFGEKKWKTLKLQARNWQKIFPKEMIITTAQMCMIKLKILLMHLVKHIELVRKYLTFDTQKSNLKQIWRKRNK